MICRKFIEYFNEQSDEPLFMFGRFKFDIIDRLTPNKMLIPFPNDRLAMAYQFRDCFVSNMGLNGYFYNNDGYKPESIKRLVEILIETESGQLNEDQIAQLTLLVHMTKSRLATSQEWNSIFSFIKTIQVIKQVDFEFRSELLTLFQKIKSNEIINEKIVKAAELVTEKKSTNYTINDIKLYFCTCAISGLNAYAGIDCIYINVNEIKYFIDCLSPIFTKEIVLSVLKLNFTRMVIHESCHIFVRRLLDDFNASSPKVQRFTEDANNDLFEAGIYAEKQIFSERICWFESAVNSKFDLKYCNEWLNKTLLGKNLVFDFKKSGCCLNTDPIKYSAIDFGKSHRIELF